MIGFICMGFVACGEKPQSQESAAEQAAVEVQSMAGEELTALLQDDAKTADLLLLDVRDASEFEAGHIDGATNIFVDELESRLSEIEGYKDKQIVLYCNTGNKSGKAGEILVKNGFTKVYNAEGVKQFDYELVQ